MLAVISDIHSNLEALSAVLGDIDSRGVKQIVCLGDVVGYGPQPTECLDLIMSRCDVTLMGNHDFAVMFEPNKFNIGAETASFWTRQRIAAVDDADRRGRYWDFLGNLPVKHVMSGQAVGLGELAFVHGSPRRPINEYVFPDDVYSSPTKVQALFDRFNGLCFIGHTHVPGVLVDQPDFYSPDEVDWAMKIAPGQKALVNVGSVGQPRDRDRRASYVVLDGGTVHFVRVEYDVESTVQKVYAVPELDDYLGDRLREGR